MASDPSENATPAGASSRDTQIERIAAILRDTAACGAPTYRTTAILLYDAGLRAQGSSVGENAHPDADLRAVTITRDDLDRALQLEFPEPTTESVWGHLEAFAER